MSLVRNGSNRVTVYPNQIAYETDILRTNMYKMSDIAFLAQTLIGNGFSLGNAFGGLPCTPTSPPSLNVQVGPGAMYSYQEYDATQWSSIPADTTDMLYKQAVNLSTISTASASLFPGGPITAPGTTNTSVYWIIEAQFQTQDLNNVNRPYYNPSNPSVPQFNTASDTRQDYISFKLKQGTPYSGVSPVPANIPAPDAGYTGLFAIFVTFGQTTITSGNITVYPDAPFITQSLIDVITYADIQSGYGLYAADTGTANAYVANPVVAYQPLTAGTRVDVLIANSNTAASNLNVSSLGNTAIRKQVVTGLSPLIGGELAAGVIAKFEYDGTYWQLLNPAQPAAYAASATAPSSQVVANGATAAPVQYTAVTVDPYGVVTYNSGTFKFTVNQTGLYLLTGSVQPSTSGAVNGDIFLTVTVGASTYNLCAEYYVSASGALVAVLNGATILSIPAGTTVFFGVTNSSGQSATLQPASSPFGIQFLGQ